MKKQYHLHSTKANVYTKILQRFQLWHVPHTLADKKTGFHSNYFLRILLYIIL